MANFNLAPRVYKSILQQHTIQQQDTLSFLTYGRLFGPGLVQWATNSVQGIQESLGNW